MQFSQKSFCLQARSQVRWQGHFFFLVEEAQVENKIGRIVSSYEDNGPIDTRALQTST